MHDAGEHASLNAIHDIVPSLCPKSFGHGRFSAQPSTSFLVTDYLNLTSRSGAKSSAPSLASKLAKLHTTPAPTPEGYDTPMFGFPATTCCGDTPQDNSYKRSWADFYAVRSDYVSRRRLVRHSAMSITNFVPCLNQEQPTALHFAARGEIERQKSGTARPC
jgi:fructosamine-3-kinase